MRRRIVPILRFLLPAAIVATLTVLIIRGRDPSFLSRHEPSRAEQALGRTIDPVNLHGVPFKQGIAELERQAGIRIELDHTFIDTGYGDGFIDLPAQEATLGEVLSLMFYTQVPNSITFFPDGDRVRLVGGASSAPLYFDEYPLADFVGSSTMKFGIAGSEEIPSVGYESTSRALELLADRSVAPVEQFAICPPHVLILATASSHLEFKKVFAALTPGGSIAALRALPPRTELFDLVDGQIVSRDHYLATDALRTTLPAVKIPPQTLAEALAFLARQAGVQIKLDDPELADPTLSTVMLDAKQVTLAAAMTGLLRQASADSWSFTPDRETVHLTVSPAPNVIRVYNLHAWFAGLPPMEREQAAKQLIDVLDLNSNHTDACFLGPNLVVNVDWLRQEAAETTVLRIVNGKPPRYSTKSP